MVPKISVVISTYNRKDDLKECLYSLFNQDFKDFEIIVVDDGSTDGTEEEVKQMMEESFGKLNYFKIEHKGQAAARNYGIKCAGGEIIAFTDSDCIADKKWLERLYLSFTKDYRVAAVRGRIIAYEPKTIIERFSATHIQFNPSRVFGIDISVTANVAFRKKVFENVGLFDENISFRLEKLGINVTGEDSDFSFRVLWKGYETVYEPRAKIYHKYRSNVVGLFKQSFGYGVGHALIFKNHREKLGRRYIVHNKKDYLLAIIDLPLRLPWRIVTLFHHRHDKIYYLSVPFLHFIMNLGLRVGRAYGSIKFKVICL